ncbi:MAG: SBBP repeat-containing protein, partial [Owenweeksia sp.]
MKFLVYPFIFVLLSLNMLYSQPMVHGWAARYSGPGTYDGVRARSVFVDHAGNSYTAGDFTGSMDADPGSGTNLLTAPQSDIYITKLDQNGQYHWTTQLNCTGISQCNAISVDNNGDIYITGSFRDTLDADPGINSYNLISYGHSDCFIIKLDINGQFVWGKSFGGLSGDEGVSMALDEQAVYVTGTFVD